MSEKKFSIPWLESRWAFWKEASAIVLPWIPPAVLGVVMGWLAYVAKFLQEYAPFSWAAAGLLAFFVFCLSMAAYGKYLGYRAETILKKEFSLGRKTVNPLNDVFENETINANDFFTPFYPLHEGKRFKNCHFYGPATIVLSGATFRKSSSTSLPPLFDCNVVIIRPMLPRALSIVIFQHCEFIDCVFYRCTVCAIDGALPGVPDDVFLNLQEAK